MIEVSKNEVKRLVIVVTTRVTVETFVMKFAEHLASLGNEVVIIADGISWSERAIGKGSLVMWPVSMSRDPNVLTDLKSLRDLFVALKEIRPSVLVYATPKASLLASINGFALRIPSRVYQVWGLRLETTSGLKRVVLSGAEFLTSLLSTVLLANSKSLATRFTSLKLNAGKLVHVIGEGSSHGVDLEFYSAESVVFSDQIKKIKEQTQEKFVVGFVGRMHPDKGINTLLKASELLARSGFKFVLLLVGDDEGAEIPASMSSGFEIIRIGHSADVRPYLCVMDILVLPSLREGFPNVVLEAASMSKPAVVSDGTGVVDSVVPGETGLVVPVGDSFRFAQAIRQLGEDPHLRARMGKSARARVEKHFSQDFVWKETLNYFQ